MRLLMATLLAASAFAADPKVIVPANGVPPVGPYSPGLLSGGYLYISGQGVRDSKSAMPEGIAAQTRQCLRNVQGILDAAGMTTADVVSVQIFLADLKDQPAVDKIYLAAYPANPPRVVMGAAKMPTDTTVEITVVAHKGAPADRVYLPAVYGATKSEVETKLNAELRKAGLTVKNLLYANRYVSTTPVAGEIPVAGLPNGATHAIFAIAAKTAPANAAFCEVIASDPKGTIEDQTKSAFAKLKFCLEAKGLTLANALATNVYLDDITDFAKMNAVYASYFPTQKPTRTTIQTAPSSKGSLVRLSAVAAR